MADPVRFQVFLKELYWMLPNDSGVFKAGSRYEFHIHLDTLNGIFHLFIRLAEDEEEQE